MGDFLEPDGRHSYLQCPANVPDTRYRLRCNDPKERDRWRQSGLVRVDSLRAGTVFECIDGTFWRVDGRNRTGTIHVEPWGRDGEPDDFVASAMVRPQSLDR